MENNINEIIESAAAEIVPVAPNSNPKWPSYVLLFFALLGVGATGYFIYKGVVFIVSKAKDGTLSIKPAQQNAQAPQNAQEAPKAVEQPAK